MDTLNEAEAAFFFSVWIGAAFYFACTLGKKPFEEIYSKKYFRRNLWTGYGFTLLLAAALLYLFWWLQP